jgi:phosphate transport system protein
MRAFAQLKYFRHKTVMNMSLSSPHTLSAFDADLREVTGLIGEMSGLVIAAIEKALSALTDADQDVAAEIATTDRVIDELQARIEKAVVRTIALRAPLADDLRALVVAIRLAALLERAGDHAKGISRSSEHGWPRDAAPELSELARMGEHASAMLRDAIAAFAAGDSDRASRVRSRDATLNSQYAEIHKRLLHRMNDDANFATAGTQLLLIGKKIERIGDYAASISDSVQYMVTGEHFADWRGDPDLAAAA